jgi:5-methylcytosine-specific restriction endonuclease McrA
MCQWVLPDDTLCLDSATDVDHIVPGDNHDEHNLQSLCPRHHRRKSSGEGAAAGWSKKKAHGQRFRRGEGHPGML